MSSLINTIGRQMSGSMIDSIAERIGADPVSVRNGIGAALPLIVSALGRNAEEPAEAGHIYSAVTEDHSGNLLDNLSEFIGGNMSGKQTDGAGILEHLFGGRKEQVEEGVSRSSGLNMSSVSRLLPLLAPIVMSALAKRREEKHMDPNGMQNFLEEEKQETRNELGGLGRLIDRDHDGSIADDIAGMGAQLFGKMFSH